MRAYDLAVLDWGIGGLSVYNEIAKVSPGRRILYLSDSGFTPYGKLSRSALKKRLKHVFLYFKSQGARRIVVACNAASTGLPDLKSWIRRQNLELIGVIEAGVAIAKTSRARKLGVIGGRRTIRSQAHAKALKLDVRSRIAQPLSGMIERGELKTPETLNFLATLLRPLRDRDALLLACTHYPAVSQQIQALLPGCRLLDPAKEVAATVRRRWKKLTSGRPDFRTTGNRKQTERAAYLAFGVRLKGLSRVPVALSASSKSI